MDGVYWQNDTGFIVDKHRMPSAFPDGVPFDRFGLDSLLIQSHKLPALGAAPVASWLLARLMQLTTEGLGFEAHGKLYNDGGGYYLNFIAFSRALTPMAFFYVHGTSAGCSCWGQCSKDVSSDDLIREFVDALLAKVHDLMPCKLVAYDTDPPDLDKRRIGKPHVLGWDGEEFLGFRTKRGAKDAT